MPETPRKTPDEEEGEKTDETNGKGDEEGEVEPTEKPWDVPEPVADVTSMLPLYIGVIGLIVLFVVWKRRRTVANRV